MEKDLLGEKMKDNVLCFPVSVVEKFKDRARQEAIEQIQENLKRLVDLNKKLHRTLDQLIGKDEE